VNKTTSRSCRGALWRTLLVLGCAMPLCVCAEGEEELVSAPDATVTQPEVDALPPKKPKLNTRPEKVLKYEKILKKKDLSRKDRLDSLWRLIQLYGEMLHWPEGERPDYLKAIQACEIFLSECPQDDPQRTRVLLTAARYCIGRGWYTEALRYYRVILRDAEIAGAGLGSITDLKSKAYAAKVAEARIPYVSRLIHPDLVWVMLESMGGTSRSGLPPVALKRKSDSQVPVPRWGLPGDFLDTGSEDEKGGE